MALPAGAVFTIKPAVKTIEELRAKLSKKARLLSHDLNIQEPAVGDICQVLTTGNFYAFDGKDWIPCKIGYTSGAVL